MNNDNNLFEMSAKLDDMHLIEDLREILPAGDSSTEKEVFLNRALPLLKSWLQDVHNSENAFSQNLAA